MSTIPVAAVNWNLAEFNARPAVRVQSVRAIDALACGPRIRELAGRAHAAAAQGDEATAEALRAEAEALIDAELPPVTETFPLPDPDTTLLDEIETRRCLQASEDTLTTKIGNHPTSPLCRGWIADRERVRRARRLLAENGLPIRNSGGWLVWSGRKCYRVTEDFDCDCLSGQHGTACKHVELVRHTDVDESPYAEAVREAA